jgi:signal transduction histidine kinase
VLSSLNLLLFIFSVVAYVADEQLRIDNISKELEMVNYVNAELEDYVAITEKIGEDKERKRLAREIHDTLGHALTGIAAGVDACIALIDINPAATKKQLEVVAKVVRQGIGDVRASLNKLRPGALEQNGFKVAMENMIQEFMDVSTMKIHFDYQLQDFDFDNTKEDILFRIVQECITNALRHGLAKEVWISMYADGASVILSVRDNGKGCSQIHMGYGLKQMSERVGMLGGKIFFNGDEGFLTIVNIPIKKGETE